MGVIIYHIILIAKRKSTPAEWDEHSQIRLVQPAADTSGSEVTYSIVDSPSDSNDSGDEDCQNDAMTSFSENDN